MADNNEYVCIDTKVIRECQQRRQGFISKYDAISVRYDWIIRDLSENWKGESADLFLKDAEVIRKNITGIADMLAYLCNTLDDVLKVICQTDAALGDVNRNPTQE